MDLHAYPRPEDDTGIGIHWCAGASAAAPQMVEEFWLPELIALGVKWVKIAGQRDALRLAQALLAARIMPIVRIARAAPGPGPLAPPELKQVEELVRAGVRYFEFDSEPRRAFSWYRDRLPTDALSVAAQAAAANMQAVLERGGLPAIPALSAAGDWALAKEIQRVGGDALFDQPIWLAIHNYSSNRPVQYPEDAVHREGAPLSRELYAALAAEAGREDPWQGRPLTEINDLRRRLARAAARPAPSDSSAPNGWRTRLGVALEQLTANQPLPQLPPERVHWRAFEHLNAQVQQLIGRSLPILSTANGYLIDENADPRYPSTTPALHMAQTLEICRAMMGTSRRAAPAPDYYFCTAFWLLAHDALQGEGSVDERSAWYSPLHFAQRDPSADAGATWEAFGWSALPIVPLLKAEPKQRRERRGERKEEREKREPFTPPASALTPRSSLLTPRPTGEGVICGKVRGGAGAQLRLTHGDGFAYESLARLNGAYRFVELPAGRYSLEVSGRAPGRMRGPAGSRADAIDLAPAQELHIDLAAYGWGIEIDQRPMEHGRMLNCEVELLPTDKAGTPALRISGSERKTWVVPLARSSQGRPQGAETAHCEVGPLPSDTYRLEVLGLPDSGASSAQAGEPPGCQVAIDRGMATDVRFVYVYDEKRAVPQSSAIAGVAQDGAGRPLGHSVRLRAEDGSERMAAADESGRYAFDRLPAGVYFLDVKSRHLLTSPGPLALDGRNRIRCDLLLLPDGVLPAAPEPALLQGQTQPGTAQPSRHARQMGGAQATQASQQVALLDGRGQRYVTHVEPSGAFQFDRLPAGDYDLYADGFARQGIHLDAGDRLSLQLPRSADGWSSHTRIQTAARGRPPVPGMIRVQWLARADLTISVEGADGSSEERRASGAAGGPYRAEFGPFPPGTYRIHSPQLPVSAEARLAAEEAAVVTFTRGADPAQS